MFSEPVIGEKFFGREEVLDLLSKRACALKEGYRQNIALTGQSLAGKTSIIHHFMDTIREEQFVTVYVEVVKEHFRSFSSKFIATLLYSILTRLGEDVEADLDPLLERAQRLLPKTCQAIRHITNRIDKAEYDDAYQELLGLTSVLKNEAHVPCIVILDEFDNLDYIGVKNPFLNFGKVIMVQKDTMYIVSSSRDTAIKKILSEKLSLLFGNFEIVKVAGFDVKASRAFLTVRLTGYDVDDAVKRFVISVTDGNPFYLETLTAKLKDAAIGRMTSHIDHEILREALFDTAYHANGKIHQYITSFLLDIIDSRHKDISMGVLTAIASGKNRRADISKSLRSKQTDIAKDLVRLGELGLVSKNGVFYEIDDAMIKFWLRFVYQKKKALLVDDLQNRMRVFSRDIDAYFISFKNDCAEQPVSRVAGLFNAFANELVSVEGKNIRLPHFTKVDVKTSLHRRPLIVASFRGRSWIVQVFENEVIENDIVECVREAKARDERIAHKIIIPLYGIEENARLLAKELRISLWDLAILNTLMSFYGKHKVVVL